MKSFYNNKFPISVVILTKNEELTIKKAISSVIDFFDEVIVLDSYSDDHTESIAMASGAVVVKNVFKGYASQRSFALKEMHKNNNWVFFLDADEIVTDELVEELREKFNWIQENGIGIGFFRRKDFFLGKWIKRSSGYPTWFGRLCKSDAVEIKREINEEYHSELPTMQLKSHLVHYPFSKGIEFWITKHNRYSTMEADEILRKESAQVLNVFKNNPTLRRKAAKEIFMSLPFRPMIAFLYLYIIRFGFLDGKAGLYYSLLRSFYEFLIDIKADEKKE